ncbi:hypothetical protein CTI12_AA372010 [Artemisia annua]|uniref:Ty3 transposon capsid-like protein domain-containing protein n=1 Tax=Artemisia annua TaxID=35608 RepID=A0A2U1MKH4_ARTAN|nr:hypothetical protein CTI12_AA372010 [Artemisia annua]
MGEAREHRRHHLDHAHEASPFTHGMEEKSEALSWHQAYMKEVDVRSLSWKKYLAEMRSYFMEGILSKPIIELRNLKLTSTVEQYNSEFNSLRNQVDVPPDVLLDLYLGGLPAELLHTIHLFNPKTVNQAMRLARLQEGAYYALWGLDVPKSQLFHNDNFSYEKNRGSFSPSPSALPSPKFLPPVLHSQPTSAPKKPYTPTSLPKPYIKPSNSATNQYPATNKTFPKNTPFKTLSKREYDEKRRNSQCFSSNEKYSPGHICKNSKLYMILSPEIEDVGEIDVSTGSESNYRDESSEGHDGLALSIHALLGSWGSQTLQISSVIKRQIVSMLVDSGSSHNFINISVARRLGLKLIAIPTKIVSVANGLKLLIQFIIKSLKWRTNGVEFEADFFAMPIGGYDVVLGINWLSTLGEIKFDFKLLYMEFNWRNKVIRFNGRPKITHEWDKSTDLIAKGPCEQAYLVDYSVDDMQFCAVKLGVPTWMHNQSHLESELQQLLDSFSDLKFSFNRIKLMYKSADIIDFTNGMSDEKKCIFQHPQLYV